MSASILTMDIADGSNKHRGKLVAAILYECNINLSEDIIYFSMFWMNVTCWGM